MIDAGRLKRWLSCLEDDYFVAIDGAELVALGPDGRRRLAGFHIEVGFLPAEECFEPVPVYELPAEATPAIDAPADRLPLETL
jgi:hypothetical protein